MPGDDFTALPEPQTEVDISSGDTMNITISKSCLNVFNNLAKVCLVLGQMEFRLKRGCYFCVSSALVSKKHVVII